MKVKELFESESHDLTGWESNSYGILDCGGKKITSLNGAPKKVNTFLCGSNNLKDLKGGPERVLGDYNCEENQLTSLEGIAKTIGDGFWCRNNKLTSLHNIHKMVNSIRGGFYATENPINECLLGLLKIKDLDYFEFGDGSLEAQDIINKYLPNGNIIECQGELIAAGYEKLAKL
jgi:hypothetical protein